MDLRDLPLTALRAIRLISEGSSVSRAAQILRISQPAVSKSIAALEERLGVSLVLRDARPISLTAEGTRLAAYASRIEVDLSDLTAEMSRLKRGDQGTVTIGSFGASASTRLLPNLLRGFARHYPKIPVAIREFDDQDISDALLEGAVDAAVLANPSATFDQIPLGQDELVALFPKGHRLAAKPALAAADFLDDPFIVTKAGSEPLILEWFAKQGEIVPQAQHRIRQTASIMALVESGLGISIVARYALPPDSGRIEIRPLTPRAPRSLALVRTHGSPPSNAVHLFWTHVQRAAV